MKRWIIGVICLLGACTGREVMTSANFQKTHVGMSEETLVKTYGRPLNTYVKDDGTTIYEYVERFQMGSAQFGGSYNSTVEARTYLFYIKDHKIIRKQMVIRNQPGYEPMNQL